MASIVDIFNDILKHKGEQIIIVIDSDDMIWFYAKNVMNVLGYDKEGTNVILKRYVNIFNKTTYDKIKEYSKIHHNVQDHSIFINEPGLYELILESKKPKAREFREWIVQSVIPEIRKTGKYIIEKTTRIN
jgi:anti-repressor protein